MRKFDHADLYKGGRCLACIDCEHKSCRHCYIDWDHAKYVEYHKEPDEWWNARLVSSMARMIYHASDGHGSDEEKAYLACDETTSVDLKNFSGLSHGEAIASAKAAGKLEKVVVVMIMHSHFRLLVFEIKKKEVRLVDGYGNCLSEFQEASNSHISEYTHMWFEVFSEEFGGEAGDYKWVWDPYLKQLDGWNCGPVAVLAVHYELTGVAMLGETKGSAFVEEYRSLVADKFVDMFKDLYRSKSLLAYKSVRRGPNVTGEAWEYFDRSESYRPSAVPETPECITALVLKVAPEIQAGPLLRSHGGASGESEATSAVEHVATGAAKILLSQGRDQEAASSRTSEMEAHAIFMSIDGRCLARIKCDHKSCHESCIDWDYKKFVVDLKIPNEWWVVSIVSSMARMMCHRSGHKSKAYLVCDFSTECPPESFEGARHKETIALAKRDGNLNKVLVVALLQKHYILLVFDTDKMEVRLVDGRRDFSPKFKKKSNSKIANYTRKWLDVLPQRSVGGADDYGWVSEPYLKQPDTWNCGPIAVLAVHYELTGVAMVGETKGSSFLPEYRPAVVDKFVEMFKDLHRSKSLLKIESDGGSVKNEPWDYVDPNDAYELPVVASTPPRTGVPGPKVTPDDQANSPTRSGDGASDDYLSGNPSFGYDAEKHASKLRPIVEGGQGRNREFSPSSDVVATADFMETADDARHYAEPPSHALVQELTQLQLADNPGLGDSGNAGQILAGLPSGSSAASGSDAGNSAGIRAEDAQRVSVPPNQVVRPGFRTAVANAAGVHPPISEENIQRRDQALLIAANSLSTRKFACVLLPAIFQLAAAVSDADNQVDYIESVARLNTIEEGAGASLVGPARVDLQSDGARGAIKAAAEAWFKDQAEAERSFLQDDMEAKDEVAQREAAAAKVAEDASAFANALYENFNIGRKFFFIAKFDFDTLVRGGWIEATSNEKAPFTDPTHWFWVSVVRRIGQNATMSMMRKYNTEWFALYDGRSRIPFVTMLQLRARRQGVAAPEPRVVRSSGRPRSSDPVVERTARGRPKKRRKKQRCSVSTGARSYVPQETKRGVSKAGDLSGDDSESEGSSSGADAGVLDSEITSAGTDGNMVYVRLFQLLQAIGAQESFVRLLNMTEGENPRLGLESARELYNLLMIEPHNPSESD